LNRTPDHTDPQPNPRAADPHADRALFALIATGDEEAFREIFHHYRKTLYPVILSLVKIEADAKEILQETFLKLWLKRETLPAIENPGGWLYSVASTEALMHLRKEARYSRRLQKIGAEPELKDIHEQFDAKEVKALINEAVEKLPARRRRVFQMSRLEGYSRKEIAATLNISENTVRNQLTEAVEFIRDYITKNKSIYLPAILIFYFF